MASADPSKEIQPVDTAQTVGYSADDFEFETVHTEAPDQIQFEMLGDTYIGRYIGYQVIWPDPGNAKPEKANAWFVQLSFTDPSGAKVINPGYDLRRAFLDLQPGTGTGQDNPPEFKEKIAPQSITRIIYVKDVDVDQNDPMRSFRVDTVRARADNSGQ